jgi:hypothetical protein
MLASFIVFLVMNIPDTEKPTIVLMMALPTVKECQAIVDRAPRDQKDRFACIKVDMRPDVEGQAI